MKLLFKRFYTFQLLVLIQILLIAQIKSNDISQQQLDNVAVTCEPSIVGEKSASLTIMTQLKTTMPINGYIKLTVPIETDLVQGIRSCIIFANTNSISSTCSASGKILTIKLSSQILSGLSVTITMTNGFISPLSTLETSSFQLQTFSSNGVTLLDQKTTGITIMMASPDNLISSYITQVDNTIVGQSTKAYITFTIQNQLENNAQVQVIFPKWNPNASSNNQISMVSNLVSCSNKNGMSASMSCSYDSNKDTLTVINSLPTGAVGSSTFSFYVDDILNPISTQPISITIQTMTANGLGIVDRGTAQLIANTAATISSSQVTLDSQIKIVQELTDFKITFSSPLPLNPGTIVIIVFPSIFPFDSTISSVSGFGLFGQFRNFDYTENPSQRSIKITNAITSYTNANIAGTIIISKIRNPFYVKLPHQLTDTFSIFLQDSQGNQIANIQNDIFNTPIIGQVQNIQVSFDETEVNKEATLTLSFKPLHQMTTSAKLNINFPTNLEINCNIQSKVGFSNSIFCDKISANTLQFSSLFDQTYTATSLKLALQGIKLPASVQTIRNLKIDSFEYENGNLYQIDSGEIDQLIDMTPGQFLQSSVVVDTQQTYTITKYTFTFKLENEIPQNGKLKLELPSEITISSISNLQNSCKPITNLSPQTQCVVSQENGVYSININNAFDQQAISAQSIIQFSISSLRTPLSTQTSSSFKFYSMDSSNQLIDQLTKDLTVTMIEGSQISSISAISDSNIVGAITNHKILFTTPVPLLNNYILTIKIPQEITVPDKIRFYCSSNTPLATKQPCSLNNQVITLKMQTISSVKENNSLQILIHNIQNPLSTKATSSYLLQITDQDGYTVSQITTNSNAIIKPQVPASIKNFNFTALETTQFAVTTITISFINVNPVPIGGYIHVRYDKIFTYITDVESVKCTSNIVSNINCEFPTDNEIIFKDIFLQTIQPGKQIQISINNIKLAVDKKMITPSWILTTYTNTDDRIDRISNGLTLTFSCNSPCQTCQPNSPSYCTSCNSLTGLNILYQGKCYFECPSGLFYDNGICKGCDDKCNTCSQQNPLICTSCKHQSQYPYLVGQTCSNTCLQGFFANNQTYSCDPCQSPCLTCSESATKCLSCSQNQERRYFYKNQCLNKCPSGYLANDQGMCIPCDPNCKECQGTTTTCVSCYQSQYLSLLDNSCQNACPFGLTVLNFNIGVCEVCNDKCKTCSKGVNFCTSCQENFNMKESTGECLSDCGIDGKMVSVNGICEYCNKECKTCQGQKDQCLTCHDGQVFQNYKCLNNCPTGYHPNELNRCILIGLQCPFGYEVNPMGNACLLKAQICEEGFLLNYYKTKCIPVPGQYIPFPLCFACFILTLIAIFSKIKNRQTLLVTNIIAFMSIIEVIGIIVQIIQSYQIDLYITFALSLLAFLFLIGSNVFFQIIYLKQIKVDATFKYWMQNYHITSTLISYISGIFNFKFYRMIYSKLFGFDNFNAPFNDQTTFFKPFTFISIFNLVTTTLLLLIANIVGFIFIQWGYQVTITCIEMMIIEIVMLILSIYEKMMLRKKLVRQMPYYKIEPKLLNHDNVMSMFDDSYYGGNTKGGLQSNEIISIEYQDRKKMLEKIVSSIIGKDHQQQGETTIDFINHLQEQEYMKAQMRRCRSFREIREVDEEQEKSEDEVEGEEIEIQNFISEPNSPREKDVLHNPKFSKSLFTFNRTQKLRDNYDNVYAESKPYCTPNNNKLVTVKVQTNLAELLGFDEIIQNGEQISESESLSESNIDHDFTQKIISNVIQELSDIESKEKRINLPQQRLQQKPQFDLFDIMGQFDIDKDGNLMLIKRKDGRLYDKQGRRVNEKGYLIDIKGNIISQNGQVIFNKEEIGSDNEIPAHYRFDNKNKQQLEQEASVQSIDDKIIDEFNRHKLKTAQSNSSSVESMRGLTPSQYTQKNNKMSTLDESFISQLIKPMKAKTKEELMRRTMIETPIDNKQYLDDESQITVDSKQDIITRKNVTSQSRRQKDTNQNKQTARNLMFSAFSTKQGNNKVRPNQVNQSQLTQSTIYQSNQNNGSIPQFIDNVNQSAEIKIQQLKEALNFSYDDQKLMNNLAKIEQSLYQPRKKKLNKKHLEKVYGKVQSKINQKVLYPKQKETISNNYFQDDEISSSQPKYVDTKLKGLENIYLKSNIRAGSQMSKKQMNTANTTAQLKQLQHSFNDTSIKTMLDISDLEDLKWMPDYEQTKVISDKQTNIQSTKHLQQTAKIKSNLAPRGLSSYI